MGSGKFTIYSNVGAPIQGLQTVDTKKKGEAKYVDDHGAIVENGKDSNAVTTLSKMEIIIEEILAREDSPDTIEIYATGVWRTDDQSVANFLHIKESLEAKFGTDVITVMRPITGEEECTWGSKSIMNSKTKWFREPASIRDSMKS